MFYNPDTVFFPQMLGSDDTHVTMAPVKHQRWERPINGHSVDYHYTYDPERNSHIIVAKISEDCQWDVISAIEDDPNTPIMICNWHKKMKKCWLAPHPTARASCEPRDTFDLNFGKNLAHDRLEVAYWSQYENRMGKFNEILLEMFEKNSQIMTKVSEAHLQRED